jgi:ketosteroid isomerase-like protein
VDIAAETKALKEAFGISINAIQTRDAERLASTFADDLISSRGDKGALTKSLSDRFSQGLYSLNHSILKIELSASGDMGYIAFKFDYAKEGEEGAEITGPGYNVSVWKKQADGTWKQVAF